MMKTNSTELKNRGKGKGKQKTEKGSKKKTNKKPLPTFICPASGKPIKEPVAIDHFDLSQLIYDKASVIHAINNGELIRFNILSENCSQYVRKAHFLANLLEHVEKNGATITYKPAKTETGAPPCIKPEFYKSPKLKKFPFDSGILLITDGETYDEKSLKEQIERQIFIGARRGFIESNSPVNQQPILLNKDLIRDPVHTALIKHINTLSKDEETEINLAELFDNFKQPEPMLVVVGTDSTRDFLHSILSYLCSGTMKLSLMLTMTVGTAMPEVFMLVKGSNNMLLSLLTATAYFFFLVKNFYYCHKYFSMNIGNIFGDTSLTTKAGYAITALIKTLHSDALEKLTSSNSSEGLIFSAFSGIEKFLFSTLYTLTKFYAHIAQGFTGQHIFTHRGGWALLLKSILESFIKSPTLSFNIKPFITLSLFGLMGMTVYYDAKYANNHFKPIEDMFGFPNSTKGLLYPLLLSLWNMPIRLLAVSHLNKDICRYLDTPTNNNIIYRRKSFTTRVKKSFPLLLRLFAATMTFGLTLAMSGNFSYALSMAFAVFCLDEFTDYVKEYIAMQRGQPLFGENLYTLLPQPRSRAQAQSTNQLPQLRQQMAHSAGS